MDDGDFGEVLVAGYLALLALAVLTIILILRCSGSQGQGHPPAQGLARELAAPPVPVPLPYFLYAGAADTLECAICLEPVRPGQLCSKVPSCRHVFHGDCLGQEPW
ncbi:hypothetical protein BS78_K035000 [Paspalum vaginatum]|uniref:RING-type E3 ubiquitin transferase n=1 Tax=Paspalum vaginatum TaxID=158149 RepID=A0A9W7XD80_9POAL|nr:hypothetical protein BS78_K035000 [Paspalum vaginatum]